MVESSDSTRSRDNLNYVMMLLALALAMLALMDFGKIDFTEQ
jgi:hypothetical protein